MNKKILRAFYRIFNRKKCITMKKEIKNYLSLQLTTPDELIVKDNKMTFIASDIDSITMYEDSIDNLLDIQFKLTIGNQKQYFQYAQLRDWSNMAFKSKNPSKGGITLYLATDKKDEMPYISFNEKNSTSILFKDVFPTNKLNDIKQDREEIVDNGGVYTFALGFSVKFSN